MCFDSSCGPGPDSQRRLYACLCCLCYVSSQAILLARQIHIFVTCQVSCVIVLGKILRSITVLPRGREDRGPVAGPGNRLLHVRVEGFRNRKSMQSRSHFHTTFSGNLMLKFGGERSPRKPQISAILTMSKWQCCQLQVSEKGLQAGFRCLRRWPRICLIRKEIWWEEGE